MRSSSYSDLLASFTTANVYFRIKINNINIWTASFEKVSRTYIYACVYSVCSVHESTYIYMHTFYHEKWWRVVSKKRSIGKNCTRQSVVRAGCGKKKKNSSIFRTYYNIYTPTRYYYIIIIRLTATLVRDSRYACKYIYHGNQGTERMCDFARAWCKLFARLIKSKIMSNFYHFMRLFFF